MRFIASSSSTKSTPQVSIATLAGVSCSGAACSAHARSPSSTWFFRPSASQQRCPFRCSAPFLKRYTSASCILPSASQPRIWRPLEAPMSTARYVFIWERPLSLVVPSIAKKAQKSKDVVSRKKRPYSASCEQKPARPAPSRRFMTQKRRAAPRNGHSAPPIRLSDSSEQHRDDIRIPVCRIKGAGVPPAHFFHDRAEHAGLV